MPKEDDDPLETLDTLSYWREGCWFDSKAHLYYMDGVTVPSVTQAMEAVRSGADWLLQNRRGQYLPIRFEAVHPEVMARAMERGKDVHMACADRLRGLPDYWSGDPVVGPYMIAFELFLRDTGFRVDRSETQLFSAAHRYGGTFDITGWLYPGTAKESYSLIDIKTGVIDVWVGVQTAGYAMLMPPAVQRTISRHALKLARTGKYRFHSLTDANDFAMFQHCVNAWRWISAKGGR